MPKEPLVTNRSGFSIFEGVVVVAISIILAVVVVGEIASGFKVIIRAQNTSRATELALEAIEVVKNIRDANFYDLEDGVYGLKFNQQNQWELDRDNPDHIDGYFTRTMEISQGASVSERAVSVEVAWGAGEKVELVTQFHNWIATLEDWSNPRYDGDFDLNPANSGSNNHKVQTVQARGIYLYVGNENSNGKEFLIFDITKAPDIKVEGALDLDGNSNEIAIFGDYVFVASSSQTEELQIIDVSNKKQPQKVGFFNLSGQDDALSLDVTADGQLAALGREKGGFYVFDISNPENPALKGELSFPQSAHINAIRVSGDHAFLATGDGKMRVIDISNPVSPSQVAVLNLGQSLEADCTSGALSIDITSTRAYVGCYSSDGFFIVDVSNPTAPLVISAGNFSGSNADIFHISFASTEDLVFLMSGDSSADFQVWDVANDLAPSLLSTVDLSGSPRQADYSSFAQKMIVGLESDPEIQIVAPDIVF